jgi:hypothetical protein
LLENPKFLAEGGKLRFGLRHLYPNDEELSNIYGMLKGMDAIVYRSARALGFQTVSYLFYEVNGDLPEGGIIVCKHLEWYRALLHFQERPEKVE